MALNHDMFWDHRPMCDCKGCESVSNFHGFGRHLCWACYARVIENGQFYVLTSESVKGIMQNPSSHDMIKVKESAGHEGQLELHF